MRRICSLLKAHCSKPYCLVICRCICLQAGPEPEEQTTVTRREEETEAATKGKRNVKEAEKEVRKCCLFAAQTRA